MTSIQRIVATIAVGAGLMLPAVMGTQAAPINATAQKSLGPVSEAANNQVELIGKRHHRRGGGGWKHGGGKSWKYGGGGGWKHRGHRHRRNHFYWGAPFLAAPFFYGGYYDYGYNDYPYYGYSSGYDNDCYRECREFNGPRYCRRYWRRYC
jgi:hypothetical protein